MNNGKKFDIVLMNPPYGIAGSSGLHLKFVDKCLDISNKQITVMPFSFISNPNKKSEQYIEKFNKYLLSVDENDGKLFKNTVMGNIGIYVFDNNKNENNIEINYIDNDKKYLNTLKEIKQSKFKNDIEESINKFISSNEYVNVKPILGLLDKNKEINITSTKERYLNVIKDHFSKNNASILICNANNGAMNATWMSSKVGQIFNSYKDFYKWLETVKPLYNVILFNSEKEVKNCKNALTRPLLRFILYRLQDDQHMLIKKCYHIPNINWEDDRVKTDEGLLEVCGCPKDKCKEYADYCKKIIDEVDKK